MRRESWLPGLLLHKSDAQVHRAAFVLVHLHPARDLVEGAQAGAAHVVAQRGGTMPGAGCVGGDGRGGNGFQSLLHGAIIPASSPVPAGSARSSPPRATRRTSRRKAAALRRRPAVRANRTLCSAVRHRAAHTAPQQACH